MEKTYWRSLEELENPKALRIREAREEPDKKAFFISRMKLKPEIPA